MRYDSMIEGVFLERPNRFLARVRVGDEPVMAHVKNTGRCRELLIPGVCVYLQKHNDPKRKTAYSLIAVKKGEQIVNMDSQAPNMVVWEYLKGGHGLPWEIQQLKREQKYRDSRFDLYFETAGAVDDGCRRAGFIEVKGVTLEDDGIARFPDAPTVRGLKHVYELVQAVDEGYCAAIIFVIQMSGIRYFTPNIAAQPEFLEALKEARAHGVLIKAYECHVTMDSLEITKEVPVVLNFA